MTAAPRTYCDDWGCPAMVSCARAFVRSRDDHAMRIGAIVAKRPRKPGAESCPDYERDGVRPWLLAFFGIDRRRPRATWSRAARR